MHRAIAVGAVLLQPVLSHAIDQMPMSDHDMMHMAPVAPGDPPITVTINPEARISVAIAGALPAPGSCGVPVDLALRIVNQGFVTAPLEAALVDTVPAGVTLALPPEPLKGQAEELRKLQVLLTRPGTADLTIAFAIHHQLSDFSGLDRVHFLLRCQ